MRFTRSSRLTVSDAGDQHPQPSAAPLDGHVTVEKRTFCGICEASCGLIATVSANRVEMLRPDVDHPSSQGFACSKGVQFNAVLEDPDRVLRPLRKLPGGGFEPASWPEALDDIGHRLKAVQRAHGNCALGVADGNPLAWNFRGMLAIMGMVDALNTKHHYTSGSVDINNYFASAQMLYGDPLLNPVPDFVRTDFAFMVGTNPVVSHGSMVTTGKIRETLLAIPARGGRVVVIDPRRTETAELFDHFPIRPGTDVWLLGAMLKVIFDEQLTADDAIDGQTTGIDGVREMAVAFDLDRAAAETGIPAADIQALAHDFAAAETACAYGRCGASLGRYSTLTKYFLDVLNVVTGNLDRRGGMVIGEPMIDMATVGKTAGQRGRWRTRVDGIPEILGSGPMSCLAREITTPGKGQLRALITVSTNLAMSVPGSDDIASALDQLELMVAIDPYVTDTSRHAHWILPPTLWLEREHVPIFSMSNATVPNAQWVAPVVSPRGETRDDSWIIDQICRRIGIVPLPGRVPHLLGKLGIRFNPSTVLDLLLRTGPYGDKFGLRPKGLSRKKLMAHGGAVKLADECPVGVLKRKLKTADRMVHLDQPEMKTEVARVLSAVDEGPDFPLRLFSIREYRSHNTWLLNVPKLMIGDRRKCRLEVHPDDAARAEVSSGEAVEVTSPWGRIEVFVEVTDKVTPGSAGLTHGWGHTGGWRIAVTGGGDNYNRLAPNAAAEIDQPSGNAFVNGIPVAVKPLGDRTD